MATRELVVNKKNAEVELLEILCSSSCVGERAPPPAQQTVLQSHTDTAGEYRLGLEGDLRAQMGVLKLQMESRASPDISQLFF